jgi:guanylate kinase
MEKIPHKVLIIGGPTGSGESTITREIIKRYPNFQRLVTATSRPIRSRESRGVNYHYFTKEEFLNQVKIGNIIEYTYVENRDVYYGTYKPDFELKLKTSNVIVNVDAVGVKYFKDNYAARAIFIKPSDIKMIEGRIKKRNPEISYNELEKRMQNAESEIFNEESLYDYVVVNDDGKLEEAISSIENILNKEAYLS